jgi:hypothetical protein
MATKKAAARAAVGNPMRLMNRAVRLIPSAAKARFINAPAKS